MKKILLIISLLFLISPFTSFSSNVSSSSETIEYWNKVLINRQKKISYLKKNISKFIDFIDKKKANLLESKNITEVKFQQLKFILLTSLNSPYAFRLTIKELCYLTRLFEKDIKSSKAIQTSLNQYIILLNESERPLVLLKNQEISSGLKKSIIQTENDISFVKDKFQKQKIKLDNTIRIAEDLNKLIRQDKSEFDKLLWTQIKFYFLTPRGSLFSKDTWQLSGYHFNEWYTTALDSFIELLPDSLYEWLCLLIFLVCGFIVYFAGTKLLQRIFNTNKHNIFYQNLHWFILAVTLFIYNAHIMYFPETLVTHVIAVICLIRGIMNLSWGLKNKDNFNDRLSHPLAPFFWLYIFGIILQTFNVTSVMLTCLWVIGETVVLIFMYKKTKLSYPIFEKTIIIISILVCSVTIIIASIGFVFLSVLSTLAWFLFVIGLKFGININLAFKKTVGSFNNEKYIVTRLLILGFGIPFIWIIIFSCILLWLANQLIEVNIFLNSLDTKIVFWGFSINVFYLFFSIYLFFVFKTIINLINTSLNNLTKLSKIDSSLAPSITLLVSYFIWIIYGLILLKFFGVSFTSLAVLAGGLGIGIGIGLREIINNFASGLIILTGRTIKHNDIIQMDQIWGKVIKITIRSTVIQTFDNAVLSIPNSQIISNKLLNWTHNNALIRKDIGINIAYDSDLNKVNELLIQIAENTEHVLSKPKPIVLFNDFGNSSLSFSLRVWIDNVNYIARTPSAVRTKINKVFKENGIEFAYPQLDIHIDNNKMKK